MYTVQCTLNTEYIVYSHHSGQLMNISNHVMMVWSFLSTGIINIINNINELYCSYFVSRVWVSYARCAHDCACVRAYSWTRVHYAALRAYDVRACTYVFTRIHVRRTMSCACVGMDVCVCMWTGVYRCVCSTYINCTRRIYRYTYITLQCTLCTFYNVHYIYTYIVRYV